MRRHKRCVKQRHANKYHNYNVDADKETSQELCKLFPRHGDKRNQGYTYWKDFCLGGMRKYAKGRTDRHIRSKYRNLLSTHWADEVLHDVVALKGSDYEKEFDYMWAIF